MEHDEGKTECMFNQQTYICVDVFKDEYLNRKYDCKKNYFHFR